MKSILLSSVILFALAACNNGNKPVDSVKTAKQENKVLDSAKTNGGKDTLKTDNNFMVDAASGGLLEVALGEIAMQNASFAQVKNFGKMMVTDHTKANNKLKELAAKENIVTPVIPGNDAQHKIDKLKTETGKDFDKDYVSLMIDDHKDDIKEYTKEADNTKDSAIKNLALNTLPVLQKHLNHIEVIDSVMKK